VGLDETLDLFRHYSAPFHDAASLEQLLQQVRSCMDKTGFRQITVRAPREKWLANYLEMTRELIRGSGVALEEIDKVIYVGVGRGYREPAMAYVLASHLGIRHAECFDILDACSAWSRAMRLIAPHFATGQCRHVLILNLEFNRSAAMGIASAQQGGEGCYQLRSLDELRWGVWTCTVGEAGTSTLLSAHEEPDDPWFFEFYNDADFHKYCGFTLSNHRDYDCVRNLLEESIGGSERFYAFAKEIGHSIFRYFLEALSRADVKSLLDESKVIIPHSVSITPYQKLFRELGVDEKARYSFAEHGNTVSCGVPLALSKSIAAGEVQRGDRVMLTPSGSGASYGVVSFQY
jgi:3-oxoacyl-[acyl-carrier-protein] synthase III